MLLGLYGETMNADGGGRKNKKKAVKEAKEVSWKEKKEVADKEEDVLRKDIQDLKTWVHPPSPFPSFSLQFSFTF